MSSVTRSAAASVPRAFAVPPGGYGYYGQGHHYSQVLNYTAWAFIAVKAKIREVAGGRKPNLGSLKEKPDGPSTGRKSKHLNGPQEHEEFTPWPKSHPGKRLFLNPNGPDVPYDLWAYHTLFFNMCGAAHWWVLRDKLNVPRQIWVIPTHWMRRVVGRNSEFVAWEISNPWGQTQYALAKDVVSFYEHSPLSRWEGYAVTTAIARWLDIYDSVMTTQLATFKNGANPTLHVELDESYPNPDDAMLQRYYLKWFERFQGEHNAGLPVVTGPGVKVNVVGSRPTDIGFEASEEAIRNRVLAAFGVPQALVTGDPTVDTSAYAPQRTFCRFTINPELTYMAEVITEKLLKPTWEDALCWWDDRVPDDPSQEREEVRLLKELYGISPNEARTKFGYEPWPHGGDDPIGQDGLPLGWFTGQVKKPEQEVEMAYRKAMSSVNGSDGAFLTVRDEKDLRERHGQMVNRLHTALNGKMRL